MTKTSDEKRNYYVTTSIPYINGEPHLGHAMEFVMGDVLARYSRQQGLNTLFSIGTDEHGGKIAEKAAENNLQPKELADQMSAKFKDLAQLLNLSNDRFIRTTDKGHESRAALVWQNLTDYIYKKNYIGWYCIGCEEYKSDSYVKETNGICPEHNRKYERLEEENYFFKLSAFNEKLKQIINSEKYKVIPISRRNEILSILEEGIQDLSISRPKDKIGWGIPVPGDNTQVMYVWFEALMNYITVLGYPEHKDFKDFWPADVHVVGKGINRFHAAVWPGMLLALGLPLPKMLYVHGYITVDDKKMSKSLGNVVLPQEIIKKFGVDTFRYFFLRHIPSYGDGDFSWDRIKEVYDTELANELGNTVNRTAAMLNKYQGGIIGNIPESSYDTGLFHDAVAECKFDKALEIVWGHIRGINQYIDDKKPWEIAGNDPDGLREALAYIVSNLLGIADMLDPFMPETSIKIKEIFKSGVVKTTEQTLFPKDD